MYGDLQKANSDLTKSCNSLFLLCYANDELNTIETFAWSDDMKAVLSVAPFYEEVFYPEEFVLLKQVYELLYPNKDFSQISIPVSYHKFGRLKLAGDLVGSEMPGTNSKLSAVIMAYWSNVQQNLSIDYSTMQVGVVQHFVQHKIIMNNNVSDYHLFAYVRWKELHRNLDWFGAAATVCEDASEFCYSNYLPVQRIARRCAHVIMPVKFGDITENVFIACPISFKYCM